MFILNRKFARGFDFKLKVDPLVIVLVNDPQMSYSQIKQMFGRSCRRQGTQFGAAYLLHETADMIDPWEVIKNREASVDELGGEL